MNKKQFLEKLDDLLQNMQKSEKEKAILYYDEILSDRIDEGLSEEEAVASLDDVSKIAADLLAELPLTALIQSRIKQSHEKSSNKTLWITLAICGIPFWMPLAIAFAAAVFSVYVAVWAVVISLLAVELALFVSGIVMLIIGGWNIVTGKTLIGFAMLSVGLAAIGLFILSVKPLQWLCKRFIGLTSAFLKKTKRLFISKEGV